MRSLLIAWSPAAAFTGESDRFPAGPVFSDSLNKKLPPCDRLVRREDFCDSGK